MTPADAATVEAGVREDAAEARGPSEDRPVAEAPEARSVAEAPEAAAARTTAVTRRGAVGRARTRAPATTAGWTHRHLLDVDGLSAADIDLVMRTADEMKEILGRPIPKVPTLRGTQVTILFYEASTRTRVSFEVAAKNLSADVVNIAASSSSVSKGESLVDTIRTIEALGADMIVMRHSRSGAPYLAAQVFSGHVLNGGDGWHAHPTQALLDLFTLRERLPGGQVAGRKVVILGDILHSRVARSNIWTLTTMGADVWVCGPSTLLRGFDRWAAAAPDGRRLTVTTDLRAALRGAHAVMALRLQQERMASGLLPSLREYSLRYGLTAETLRWARADALVMHPGPMNEGVEIGPEIADFERSVVTEQVANGVAVRMALLYLLAGSRTIEEERNRG
ncbi:MAG TPA: aspartate carbamoyltransferase catalytic subunit [Candidatus Acidoferrales bacterium]|nr:aspartate carbamoyltransferase catalytic subunit [Candidatus Acidoferrales bacterium]